MTYGYRKRVRDQNLTNGVELGFARNRLRHQQEKRRVRSIKPMPTDPHLLAPAPKDTPPTDALRPEISIERDGHETLAALLTRAAVSLETDHHAARTCIRRLAALLGIELRPERPTSAEHPCRRGGLAPWQAKRIKSYIEDNLGSNIRTTNLAPIVQLSTSQFFRTFRKTFGEAPLAYIMRRRILRAQERMLSSQVPLVQIALECGMCDQAHFSRVFRRIVGANPAAWRRQFFATIPHAAQSAGESSG